jgi:purine-binding chemotaxis protein CheW
MAKNTTSSTISALMRLASLPVKRGSANAEADNANQLSVVMFNVGEEVFALQVENVEGVVDCPNLAPLPSPPEGIVGVGSVRGRITLAMNLGVNPNQQVNRQRLVLLKGESQLGLIADRIEDVVTLSKSELEASGKRANEKQVKLRWPVSNYFKNKGRIIPIIDFERLVEV